MIQKSKLILVVDDVSSFRMLMCQQLKAKGYEIVEASDGKEAFELFNEYQPDLVISDINMPIWDGFDLCKAIKFNEKTGHVPVILETSYINEEFLLKSISSGADLFLTRPYEDEVLQSNVSLLLENGGWNPFNCKMESIEFDGKEYTIPTEWKHVSKLLLNANKSMLHMSELLIRLSNNLREANQSLKEKHIKEKDLLRNIMPDSLVSSFQNNGWIQPKFTEAAIGICIRFPQMHKNSNGKSFLTDYETIHNALQEYAKEFGADWIEVHGDTISIYLDILNQKKSSEKILLKFLLAIYSYCKQFDDWRSQISIFAHEGSANCSLIKTNRYIFTISGKLVNELNLLQADIHSEGIYLTSTIQQQIHSYCNIDPVKVQKESTSYKLIGLKNEYSDDEDGFLPNSSF